MADLVCHQGRGLRGALQRAGDDGIHLDFDGRQGAAYVAALLDSLFVESTFFVLSRVDDALPGTDMAREVNYDCSLSFLSSEPFRSLRGAGAGIASSNCFPSASAIRNSCALNAAVPLGGLTFRFPGCVCQAGIYFPSFCSRRAFTLSAR